MLLDADKSARRFESVFRATKDATNWAPATDPPDGVDLVVWEEGAEVCHVPAKLDVARPHGLPAKAGPKRLRGQALSARECTSLSSVGMHLTRGVVGVDTGVPPSGQGSPYTSHAGGGSSGGWGARARAGPARGGLAGVG